MNMNDMPFFNGSNNGNGGNGSTDWKDIKNKPFGDSLVEKEYIFETGNVTKLNGTNAYILSCDAFNDDRLVAGQEYDIYYTQSLKGDSTVWIQYTPTIGEAFIAETDENGSVYLGSPSVNGSYPFYFSSEVCAVNYMWVNQFTYAKSVKLVGAFGGTKKIDKEFLPDEVFAQADWSQNDKSASDYIKNRPFYDYPYRINGDKANSEIFVEVSASVGYYYASDNTPSDDLGNYILYIGDEECFATNVIFNANNVLYYTNKNNTYPYAIKTTEDNITITINKKTISFAKTGLYLFYYPSGDRVVTALSAGQLKFIESKYIEGATIIPINKRGDDSITPEEFCALKAGFYFIHNKLSIKFIDEQDNITDTTIWGLICKFEGDYYVDCYTLGVCYWINKDTIDGIECLVSTEIYPIADTNIMATKEYIDEALKKNQLKEINKDGTMTAQDFMELKSGLYFIYNSPFGYDLGLVSVIDNNYWNCYDMGMYYGDFYIDDEGKFAYGYSGALDGGYTYEEIEQTFLRIDLFQNNEGLRYIDLDFGELCDAVMYSCHRPIAVIEEYDTTIDGYKYYHLYEYNINGTASYFVFVYLKDNIIETIRIDENGVTHSKNELVTTDYIINSSTEGSTKKFKITVDDSGVISATEVV